MDHVTLRKADKIKVSDFSIVIELNRLKSLREVARLMHSTPVQISRRLTTLERTLGYKLFERTPKGLTITPAGTSVLKSALAVSGEFQAVLGMRKRGKAATLRPVGIASTSFLLSYAVIPALSEVMKASPQLRSYLLASSPDDLIEDGMKGAFHIALHPAVLDWPRSWRSELIGRVRWALFMRQGHPYLSGGMAIEDVPFVYPMVWDGAKLVVQNDNCPLPVHQRNGAVGTQTAEQAMHLTLQSDVAGFLPRILMRAALQQRRIVQVPMAEWAAVEQPVYLSYRPDEVMNSVYRGIAAAIRHSLLDLDVPR